MWTVRIGDLERVGSRTEIDKKLDVRITMKIGRNEYRYLKGTRLPGAEFEYRDGFDFMRREPPPPHPIIGTIFQILVGAVDCLLHAIIVGIHCFYADTH